MPRLKYFKQSKPIPAIDVCGEGLPHQEYYSGASFTSSGAGVTKAPVIDLSVCTIFDLGKCFAFARVKTKVIMDMPQFYT